MQQPYRYSQGYSDPHSFYASSGNGLRGGGGGGSSHFAYDTEGATSLDTPIYYTYPASGLGTPQSSSLAKYGTIYPNGTSDGNRHSSQGRKKHGKSPRASRTGSREYQPRTSSARPRRSSVSRSSRARQNKGGQCKSFDRIMWSIIGIALIFMLFRLRTCSSTDHNVESPLCYMKAILTNFGKSSTSVVSVAGSRLKESAWGNSLSGKGFHLIKGDGDSHGALGADKGKQQSREPVVLDPNMDLHPLVKKDTLFSLADFAPILAEVSVYENKAVSSVRPESGRITVAVYLESSNFYGFVNLIMGFERLDEKSGDLEIDPKRIFFVVYDIGCTEYHLQLLDNCFYSKGRSRNETNLVVDTSLKGFFDDDKQGIKKPFLARPVVFAKALEEYGFDSDMVVMLDPATFFENDLSKLRKQVDEVGIVTSTHVTFVKKVKEEKQIKDWVNPDMIESFKASHEEARNLNTAANVPNGRLIAMDARNTTIMRQVVRPWFECSTSWSCIAPPGSTLTNHLFDLSILALLLDVAKLPPVINSKELGIDTSNEASDILKESLRDMWGHMKSLNSSRQAINYTDFTHFAEVNLLQSHMFLNFITAAIDEPSLRVSMDMMNRLSEQERGTKRGNVNSFGSYQRPARLILYDMGMDSDLRRLTEISFKNAFGSNALIVTFEEQMKAFPSHCQYQHSSKCYKAVLINATMSEFGGCIIWLEPRNEKGRTPVAKKKLDRIRELLARKGFVSVQASRSVRSSVPEEIMKQFGLSGERASEALLNSPAVDSSLVAFNSHNKTIIRDLFDPWLKCLLGESCVVPSAESSETQKKSQKYQFDLAALTAAFYAGGFTDSDIAKKRNDLHISSSEPRDAQRRRRLFR